MEIELYSKLQNPIEAIDRIGQWFAASGMFGCTRKEQGMILAMACIVEKKSPLEVKRTYHLLDGELSMRSDAMLSAFRARGGKHKVIARTADRAAVELTCDGSPPETFSFTWEEAKGEPFVYAKDGGLKKNWRTPRARMQMLWSRVISDGVRTLAPEIVAGVYTPEESADVSHSDAPPANPPTIFSAPESAPSPAPASAPIDVQSSQSAPPSEPPSAIHRAALAGPGRLSVESVTALEVAIGAGNSTDAFEWLRAQGWIKQSLEELSVRRAQKILDNPTGFIDVVHKDLAAVRGEAAK